MHGDDSQNLGHGGALGTPRRLRAGRAVCESGRCYLAPSGSADSEHFGRRWLRGAEAITCRRRRVRAASPAPPAPRSFPAAFEVQPPPEGPLGERGDRGARGRVDGASPGAGSLCFPVNKAPGRGRPYKCGCGGAGWPCPGPGSGQSGQSGRSAVQDADSAAGPGPAGGAALAARRSGGAMAAGGRAAEPPAELSHYLVARPIYSEPGFQQDNERRPPPPPTLRERAQAACRWVRAAGGAGGSRPEPTDPARAGMGCPDCGHTQPRSPCIAAARGALLQGARFDTRTCPVPVRGTGP